MMASSRSLFFIPPFHSWLEQGSSEVTGQSREGRGPVLLVVKFNFYWLNVTIIHRVLRLGR